MATGNARGGGMFGIEQALGQAGDDKETRRQSDNDVSASCVPMILDAEPDKVRG